MIINNWPIAVALYLLCAVIYNQAYKQMTKNMKKAGALTVLIEALAGLFALVYVFLFEFKLPKNPYVYLFLALACIFYALNDRISTNVRSGLEASSFSIIKQTNTVYMIIIGLLFFKEEFVLKKMIGALLIIFSNILVFYKKGAFKNKKYVFLGLLASFFNTIALVIDVNYSKQFNIPIYSSFTLLVPAILIFLFERIKIKDIKEEYINSNKKLVFLLALAGGSMVVLKLRAYQLGQVIVIAPLCTLTIILNVLVGYFLFKEHDNLLKKIIAGILIVISVVLIKG